MKIAYIAFTEKGCALAGRLAGLFGGEAVRCGQSVSLAQWTAEQFAAADALIFVGAAGIAVRAIAPHIKSKATDPAVIVVDECGRFVVPVLAGHLGGANSLARRIAAAIGAEAVITTATDANGVFAVDEWARKNGWSVLEPERIKNVSAKLLAGQSVYYKSRWPITGEAPAGIVAAQDEKPDFVLDWRTDIEPQALHILPRVLALGVGCRRGISAEAIEAAFALRGVPAAAIFTVASIDLKQNEAGLHEFCKMHDWPITFYTAQQLQAVPGQFMASEFVAKTTGVDNVCERAAALAAGGELVGCKQAANGVTTALAEMPFAPSWDTEEPV